MKKSTYRAIMLTMTLFLFQTAATRRRCCPVSKAGRRESCAKPNLKAYRATTAPGLKETTEQQQACPSTPCGSTAAAPRLEHRQKRNRRRRRRHRLRRTLQNHHRRGIQSRPRNTPHHRLALSVRLKEGVLTLESAIASEEEAIAAAETIINSIK